MENKKTKLTISGSPKKTLKNFETSKSLGKKTVKINDQKIKSSKSNFNKTSGFKTQPFNNRKNIQPKSNFPSKSNFVTTDFEKRKLAEQRATKRLKGETENKEKKTKLGAKKERLNLQFLEL